jgi:hypothetical protein
MEGRSLRSLFAAAGLLLALAGCASTIPGACPAGGQPQLTAEVLFGRNIGDRHGVTDARWADFLNTVVTPRFPEGFTVLDGAGQWRDAKRGHVVREKSKLLVVTNVDDPARRARFDEIVQIYKKRFAQDAVLTIVRPACIAFN